MPASTVAYSYVRFSTVEQKKGDSLRRQTKAAADWCGRNKARLDESLTFRDLGKSAFLGEHRKNPDRHALAAFLKLVEDGKIPRGSYLIIESLDRLTREHVRAGLMLLLGLIESGVRIVQLSPSELIYDEKSDEMGLMLAIVELSRGHRESRRKSDLSGSVWQRKKEEARKGKIATGILPAWIAVQGEKLVLIPKAAATVKLIFHLAANGYGTPRIVSKLNKDKVSPIGKSTQWVRGYIGKIIRDRRAIGEYQPCKGKHRQPDGDPIADYFPAVVTPDEFYAARGGADERRRFRGRTGEHNINIFAGMMKSAREGDSYFLAQRCARRAQLRGEKKLSLVLVNTNSEHGSTGFSFPYPVLEDAFLEWLDEIDPKEIVGGNGHADEIMSLSGELATVEGRIKNLETELLDGDVPSIARVLRTQEERKRELAGLLADARAKAAHPLAESLGECLSLRSVLHNSPDPEGIRLRLRSALRRIVSEIWLLIVPRRLARLAALQVQFKGGARRDFMIYYRPAHHGFGGARPGEVKVDSKAKHPPPFDLRKPSSARELESYLAAVDLKPLTDAMSPLDPSSVE